MGKKITLTQDDKNLLNALCCPKNADGGFELAMEYCEFENLEMYLENFDDKNVSKYIKKMYLDMKSHEKFQKKLRLLAQLSIVIKMLSGRATYKFIANVTYITNMRIIKKMKKKKPFKKVKVMYFFKKIENLPGKSPRYRKKLWREYMKSVRNKKSEFLEYFILSRNSGLMGLDEEPLIIEALKNSF